MKLHNAYFFDNDRTIIRTIYHDDEHREIIRDIPAQEDNAQYKKFMIEMEKHGGIDALHERTFAYLRETQDAFEKQVIAIGKQKGMLFDGDVLNTDVYKLICNTIFKENENEKEVKEQLFMFKLALFEQDIIRESDNRELKAELRKSKTLLDALKISILIAQG
jgi:hypothetical protein|tara:strand:+ start:184 stop:672 length:489 start_codon:yes stop_codon:yes gene_type:complete